MSRIPAAFAALWLLATTGVVAAKPRISSPDARKVALAKVPGTVMHEKLKHKKHGHDLYYIKIKPRDVAKGSTEMWKKVEVDGDTGQIVKIKDTKPKGTDKED